MQTGLVIRRGVAAAERRDARRVVCDIDEVQRRKAFGDRLFAVVSDPADMKGVRQGIKRHAGFPRPVDCRRGCLGRDTLAVSLAAIELQDRARVVGAGRRRVGLDQPFVEQSDIGRRHDDTMTVVTGKIGEDQMIRDDGGLFRRAARSLYNPLNHTVQFLRVNCRHTFFPNRCF